MLAIILTLFIIDGKSVEPVYAHNETIETIHAPCAVDDYIVFRYEGVEYIKQLDHYTGRGDLWVKGRGDYWIENGVKKQSYDSSVYGYMPVDTYDVLGCVIK